ncbi:translation initiation factor IF-2 N-terminal domain-containing protein, partial [Streptomyces pseudogriseolus]|uniref:translation initiation factor IF-2 N-terminal domain-containing protein n=1 Tax=Streptomyces pseudogriseolus TaxID=36817 RepID=UPI00364C045A
MANVRVYELARKAGVDTKVVLDKMTELGHFVRSASATVEAPVVRELIDALGVAQETAVSLPRVPAPAAPPAGSVLRPQPHEWGPTARRKPLHPSDPRPVGADTVQR